MGTLPRGYVAFDIDGTLLRWHFGKGLRVMVEVFEQLFRVRIPEERYPQAAGKTDWQLFRELLAIAEIDAQVGEQRRAAFFQRFARQIQRYGSEEFQLLPGVRELFAGLRGREIGIGVVTGNIQPVAQWKLSLFALDRFVELGAYGDEAPERTQLVRLFAQRLQEQYRREIPFVLVGDSPNDVAAARHAGMPVIAVATGPVSRQRLRASAPDALLDSLEDGQRVQQLIEALWERN